MPEVIVIDEIGTELEAGAARTIAERGVQLVGTAHGNTLDNLLVNPTLSDLVGGIQPVTLGDDEARRRGTQKTVLERKAPPTFDVLVEMQDRQRVAVHRDVAETIDAVLRGQPAAVELRWRHDDGTIERRLDMSSRTGPGSGGGAGDDRRGRYGAGRPAGDGWSSRDDRGGWGRRGGRGGPSGDSVEPGSQEFTSLPGVAGGQANAGQMDDGPGAGQASPPALVNVDGGRNGAALMEPLNGSRFGPSSATRRPVSLYPYGVNRDRLDAAIGGLRLPVTVVRDIQTADVVMTLKNYYRRNAGPVRDAEEAGRPVFILKSNTIAQIQQSLEALYGMETADPPRDVDNLILQETQDAINHVLESARAVELPPQNAYIRRLQHQLAEQFNVGSRSTGREPHRRVRLFRS